MRVFKKWCTPIVQKKGLGFQNPKIRGCTGFQKVPTVTQCFHSFPPKVALDTNFAHDDDGDDVWGLCGLSVESLWSQCGLSGLKTNKVSVHKHANTKGVCGGPMAKQALFVESDIRRAAPF